jgi:type I restriction enzyme S subunit
MPIKTAQEFKKTPAGEIPLDWEYSRLGKYLVEVSDRNRALQEIPVLTVTNDRGFVVSRDYFDRQVFSKDLSNYKIVKKNCFAYNPSRVNVGSIALLKKFPCGLLSPMYVVFGTKAQLNPDYLNYWIFSQRFGDLVKAGTQGSVRDSLNFSSLAEFPFALPPKAEQSQIVNIMSSVDDVIAKIKAAIEQTQVLKKSLMQELFSRGIPGKHSKFKKTEIGVIPADWKIVPIGTVLRDLSYGTSAKCSYSEDGYPVLRIPNVISGEINRDDLKYAVIPYEQAEQYKLVQNDVLLVRTNGSPKFVGRAALVPKMKGDWLFASYLIRLRFLEKEIHPIYGYYALNSPGTRKALEKGIRTSAGNYNLSGQGIKNTPIALPSLKEQLLITSMIDKTVEKVLCDTRYLAFLEKVKSSLAQVLLTGKVRVTL